MLDLRARARECVPRLPAYDPALRDAAIKTWRGRMSNEHASASVFEALAEQLRAAGLGSALVEECRGFADEERRHGVLCGAVVEALGGEARAETRPQPPFPQHEDTTPLVAVLRNLVSVCCMSETVAVALIGAERIEMEEAQADGKPEPLTALLREIHADEIGHARFGWRLLERLAPSLSAAERKDLAAYVPTALAHLEAHELAHLPDHAGWRDGACVGLCSGRDARVLFFETMRDVIVPGLARWLGER